MEEGENALDIRLLSCQNLDPPLRFIVRPVKQRTCGLPVVFPFKSSPPLAARFRVTVPASKIDNEDSGGADDEMVDVAITVYKIQIADHDIGVGQIVQQPDKITLAIGTFALLSLLTCLIG